MKPGKKSTRVTVTWDDIKNGKRRNMFSCPVARSINRVTDGTIIVGDNYVTIEKTCHQLPLKAQKFIKKFDAGMKVKPFSFIIKIPD